MRARSRPINRTPLRSHGIGKQETNRRLVALGLSRHDDEDIQNTALAIVQRFQRWTDQQRSAVSGRRTGDVIEHDGRPWVVVVQWAHVVRTRGAYGGDFGFTLPLVDLEHQEQENNASYFAARGLNEVHLARLHAIKFFQEHPKDAAWIVQHACDGEVIALATSALAGAL